MIARFGSCRSRLTDAQAVASGTLLESIDRTGQHSARVDAVDGVCPCDNEYIILTGAALSFHESRRASGCAVKQSSFSYGHGLGVLEGEPPVRVSVVASRGLS